MRRRTRSFSTNQHGVWRSIDTIHSQMSHLASERKYQRPDQQLHIPHGKGCRLRSDRHQCFQLPCLVALIRSLHDVDDWFAATRNTVPQSLHGEQLRIDSPHVWLSARWDVRHSPSKKITSWGFGIDPLDNFWRSSLCTWGAEPVCWDEKQDFRAN